MTNSISVPAAELRRALTAVLPHCGEDDTLPALTCVKLEARDGWLYLVATDRYSMAVARICVPGGCPDHDAMLPARWAEALRAMLVHAENATVSLAIGERSLAAAWGKHSSATWPTAEHKFPRWRNMLGRILSADRAHLDGDCGLNGNKIDRFTLPDDDLNYEPLRMFTTASSGGQASASGRTVVFLRGEWFAGALMPVRNVESDTPIVSAWSALLLPSDAPAEPARDDAPAEAVPVNA